MQEYKGVTEIEQYIPGKWRVRVDIGELETIFLKYDHEPKNSEIKESTRVYLQNRKDAIKSDIENPRQEIRTAKERIQTLKAQYGITDAD